MHRKIFTSYTKTQQETCGSKLHCQLLDSFRQDSSIQNPNIIVNLKQRLQTQQKYHNNKNSKLSLKKRGISRIQFPTETYEEEKPKHNFRLTLQGNFPDGIGSFSGQFIGSFTKMQVQSRQSQLFLQFTEVKDTHIIKDQQIKEKRQTNQSRQGKGKSIASQDQQNKMNLKMKRMKVIKTLTDFVERDVESVPSSKDIFSQMEFSQVIMSKRKLSKLIDYQQQKLQ